MATILLIFITLALGTFQVINIGTLSYNLEFVEITMLLLFLSMCVKIRRIRNEELNSKIITLLVPLTILNFVYSLLTFVWTDYGLTVLPGAIPLLFSVLTILLCYPILNQKPDYYITGTRIFILVLFLQLIVNIWIGIESGASGFYAIKSYADTLIGKSNFISFFFVFELLFEFIAKKRHWQFYLIINALAIVLTVSRGAIVSLALSLVVFFFVGMKNHNFNKKKLLKNFLALGGLLLLIMFLTPSGRELIGGLSLGLEASTVGSRQLLWNEAFQEIVRNPFGIGVVWRNNPHNFILDSIRNLGLIFGTVYIFIIGSPLFLILNPKIFRLSSQSIAGIIAYLSVFIHAMIEVFYFTKISVIWTFLTLIFLYISIRRDLVNIEDYKLVRKYFFNNNLFKKFKHIKKRV
ncbi:O-antigen ligase family protein [Jeotgalibaca porci]|uniref:O-antigen ligase family protein n=1 Tax=Jeotgalibaca porci TaxID=1868793 RepID=UPI003F91194F